MFLRVARRIYPRCGIHFRGVNVTGLGLYFCFDYLVKPEIEGFYFGA